MAEVLGEDDIKGALAELDGWGQEGDALVWARTFGSFAEAFAFTSRVALLAERRDHHPDIVLGYTRLRLRLTSHDVGGVTVRDLEFARAVSSWT